ncbi:glycosyltransferase family 2 protein [Jiangella aurantiaca]|uniref:Glycosyltransferase family 2 protein n=1 Tax=Jiangella aurantiaca TaxID=2530373 RepID=A0A4R5A6N5_9ACTN|nr:glycosyltransferase family 2 protein [Jiangella aurantiaca]
MAVGNALRYAGVPDVRITVLIPAHNEEAGIGAALAALSRQTRRPDSVIVIADNCTDDTAKVAAAWRAEVAVTEGNTDKKAGALNQILADILPRLRDQDLVLVQDADSQLGEHFIEAALEYMDARPKLGAVGGVFQGEPGAGLVGYLQRNEYARYARDVRRLGGKCLVVTGTAAMMRAGTLKHLSRARLDRTVPAGDGRGGIYDTTVLTEDNELTFALLHLGYEVLSPKECTLVTEVMPTWRDLWKQRLRWKRGAVENCFQYGVTPVTWRYWGRQLLTMAGVAVTFIYLTSIAVAIAVDGGVSLQPVWMAVTGVFILERVVTVSDRGWRHMVAAATMFELVYDIFLQLVHAKAYADVILNRERKW